jgi:hypothetical protein
MRINKTLMTGSLVAIDLLAQPTLSPACDGDISFATHTHAGDLTTR